MTDMWQRSGNDKPVEEKEAEEMYGYENKKREAMPPFLVCYWKELFMPNILAFDHKYNLLAEVLCMITNAL